MKRAISLAAALFAMSSALCLTSCTKKAADAAPDVPLTSFTESDLLTLGVAEGWSIRTIDTGVLLNKDGASYIILISSEVPAGVLTPEDFMESLKTLVTEAGGKMLANRKVGGVDMAVGKYVAASKAQTLEMRGGDGTNVYKIQVNDNSGNAESTVLDSDEVSAMIDSIVFK